jgi:hypothetical protein
MADFSCDLTLKFVVVVVVVVADRHVNDLFVRHASFSTSVSWADTICD